MFKLALMFREIFYLYWGKSTCAKQQEKPMGKKHTPRKKTTDSSNTILKQKKTTPPPAPTRQQLAELDDQFKLLRSIGSVENSSAVITTIVSSYPLLVQMQIVNGLDDLDGFSSSYMLWFLGSASLQYFAIHFLAEKFPYGWLTTLLHPEHTNSKTIERAYQEKDIANTLVAWAKKTLLSGLLLPPIFAIVNFILTHYLIPNWKNDPIAISTCPSLFLSTLLSISARRIKISTDILIEKLSLWNEVTTEYSPMVWKTIENSYHFDLAINSNSVTDTEKNITIPTHKFIELLTKTLRKLKPAIRVYTDMTVKGITIADANLKESEITEIKNLLNGLVVKWNNDKKIKPLHNYFIFQLCSANTTNLIWYDATVTETSSEEKKWACCSQELNYLTKKLIEKLTVLVRSFFDDKAVKVFVHNSRIMLEYATPPTLSKEQIEELRNFCQQLPSFSSVNEKTPTAAIEPAKQQPASPFSWLANKLRYAPSIFWRSTANEIETIADQAPILPPLTSFPDLDGRVRDYDPTENFRAVLDRDKRVTLPLMSDGHAVGFIALNQKELKNLPNDGEHCLHLLQDNLTHGDGHWIQLRKNSKYHKELNASFKLRLFDINGGKMRGLLNLVKPEDDASLPVYQFTLSKHL